MSLVTENLLVQNEREANSFIVKILWVIYLLAAATLIALYLLEATHLTIANIVSMLILLGLIFVGCTVINRLFGDRVFVKYMISFSFLLGMSGFVYIIGNAAYAPIIIIIPLLISSIYYDLKLSVAVGFFIPIINAFVITGMPILSNYDEPVSTNFQIASTMILFVTVVALVFLTHWGARLLKMSLTLEKNVAEQADDLKKVLLAAKNTGDRVSASSETLAASSEQMNASLEEVAASTNEFSGNAQGLSESAGEMGKTGKDISEGVDEGTRALADAVEQIGSIAALVSGFKDVVASLDNRTQEIGKIVDAIKDIANQTNLLALNAAIESARAGEHGKGFAVVAEEVRKLAEQSERSAEEITSLIHATQEESSRAVENMEKGVVEVNSSSEAISSANNTLRSIMDKFEVIVKQIEQVATASEEIGAGSQELSSVVEEQTATMNSISEAAAELQNQVHELHEVLSRYEF